MRSAVLPFHSPYAHGYARVAACVPQVRVAAPAFNAERTVALARQAAARGAVLAIFPELGLSSYALDDLHQQDALLDAVLAALDRVRTETANLEAAVVVGAPLRLEGKLFNCAVALHRGRVLGAVPKTYLPNYREFYERRQFTPGASAISREVRLLGQEVPFGSDLLFEAEGLPGFCAHLEICEDVWTPVPPSTWAALAGATVLCNLSASNVTIGKAGYRRELCAMQSAKCIAAYVYTAAGQGESTTDLAWDGHAMIYENGTRLAESQRFLEGEQVIVGDVDLDRLRQERARMNTYQDTVAAYRDRLERARRIRFDLEPPEGERSLERPLLRFPYVPHDPSERDERCAETYAIQVSGLEQRVRATGLQRLVIGVSGGLDSTQALIVCCRTADRLGLPRTNVLAYTMPGFATSEGTRSNAWRLMKALGVSAAEIDIRPSSKQMLADLGHPFASGQQVFDVTFQNVQAGERTSHLFRLANLHGGMVVGTGDLSELALGWNTYGVGDQMSHYGVNASVPKTLIQHLIRYEMERPELSQEARAVLAGILATEISPELVPASAGILQRSEETVGPYALQDFNLYYLSRYGFRPSKVAYLAEQAWGDAGRGLWPPGFPEDQKRAFALPEIKKWLRVFLQRFFAASQFKRSAMPNGPKVGSGGSLSPRSDWRAPSDASAEVWLEELDAHVPGPYAP